MMQEIAALLKSADPKERQLGIKKLVGSGNPKTLAILKNLYQSDPDPDVQQLAARYGKELQESQSEPEPDPISVKPHVDPKKALDRAMDALIQNDYPQAWEHARNAFAANPSLRDDDYAVGLAADITGVDRSVAVATLMERPSASETSTGAGKAKVGKRKHAVDKVPWSKALMSVGAYALITAVIGVVMVVIFAGVFSDLMVVALESDPQASVEAAEMIEFLEQGSGTYIALLSLIVFVATFVGNAIGMLIGLALIHFAATAILGGDGYLSNLIYNARIPYIAYAVVSGIISAIAVYLLFASFPTDPVVWEQLATSDDLTALEPFVRNLGIFYGLSCLNLLFGLGLLYWISKIIGETYDFGTGKGCLSIIVSGIIVFVFWCGCNFALSSMIGAIAQ